MKKPSNTPIVTRGGKVKEAQERQLLIQKKMRNIRKKGIRKQFRGSRKREADRLKQERRAHTKEMWEDRINDLKRSENSGRFLDQSDVLIDQPALAKSKTVQPIKSSKSFAPYIKPSRTLKEVRKMKKRGVLRVVQKKNHINSRARLAAASTAPRTTRRAQKDGGEDLEMTTLSTMAKRSKANRKGNKASVEIAKVANPESGQRGSDKDEDMEDMSAEVEEIKELKVTESKLAQAQKRSQKQEEPAQAVLAKPNEHVYNLRTLSRLPNQAQDPLVQDSVPIRANSRKATGVSEKNLGPLRSKTDGPSSPPVRTTRHSLVTKPKEEAEKDNLTHEQPARPNLDGKLAQAAQLDKPSPPPLPTTQRFTRQSTKTLGLSRAVNGEVSSSAPLKAPPAVTWGSSLPQIVDVKKTAVASREPATVRVMSLRGRDAFLVKTPATDQKSLPRMPSRELHSSKAVTRSMVAPTEGPRTSKRAEDQEMAAGSKLAQARSSVMSLRSSSRAASQSVSKAPSRALSRMASQIASIVPSQAPSKAPSKVPSKVPSIAPSKDVSGRESLVQELPPQVERSHTLPIRAPRAQRPDPPPTRQRSALDVDMAGKEVIDLTRESDKAMESSLNYALNSPTVLASPFEEKLEAKIPATRASCSVVQAPTVGQTPTFKKVGKAPTLRVQPFLALRAPGQGPPSVRSSLVTSAQPRPYPLRKEPTGPIQQRIVSSAGPTGPASRLVGAKPKVTVVRATPGKPLSNRPQQSTLKDYMSQIYKRKQILHTMNPESRKIKKQLPNPLISQILRSGRKVGALKKTEGPSPTAPQAEGYNVLASLSEQEVRSSSYPKMNPPRNQTLQPQVNRFLNLNEPKETSTELRRTRNSLRSVSPQEMSMGGVQGIHAGKIIPHKNSFQIGASSSLEDAPPPMRMELRSSSHHDAKPSESHSRTRFKVPAQNQAGGMFPKVAQNTWAALTTSIRNWFTTKGKAPEAEVEPQRQRTASLTLRPVDSQVSANQSLISSSGSVRNKSIIRSTSTFRQQQL